ncbi:alpha/beta fold hydrolase [Halomarina litorea]|uniref:alpha/beta fold hydrolase n=1 Tax=Halomarina litorea TaxID=2961595 RepID=UPI0020C35BC0|nr:alpha/beta hydrolase [Halomarina sp. BCD28]
MLAHVTVGDGTDLYYQDVGEGPPVVLVHGFSTNHLSWWQQIPTIARRYRCLAVDQRRFGLSADEGGRGVAAFADDLLALLDALGIERAALVGHSMGGWSVASLATRHPDRVAALVLSATPGGLLSPERHRELRERATVPDPDPLDDERAFLADAIADLNRDAPPEWTDVRPTLDGLPLDRERIARADVPTLLVSGEADGFMTEGMAEELAGPLGAETATVAGAGHDVFFEKPAAFNECVLEFLDERAAFVTRE